MAWLQAMGRKKTGCSRRGRTRENRLVTHVDKVIGPRPPPATQLTVRKTALASRAPSPSNLPHVLGSPAGVPTHTHRYEISRALPVPLSKPSRTELHEQQVESGRRVQLILLPARGNFTHHALCVDLLDLTRHARRRPLDVRHHGGGHQRSTFSHRPRVGVLLLVGRKIRREADAAGGPSGDVDAGPLWRRPGSWNQAKFQETSRAPVWWRVLTLMAAELSWMLQLLRITLPP